MLFVVVYVYVDALYTAEVFLDFCLDIPPLGMQISYYRQPLYSQENTYIVEFL